MDRLYIGKVNTVITQIERDFAPSTDEDTSGEAIALDSFVARYRGIDELEGAEYSEDDLADDFDYWTDDKVDVVCYQEFKEAFANRGDKDVEEVLEAMKEKLLSEVAAAGITKDRFTVARMHR